MAIVMYTNMLSPGFIKFLSVNRYLKTFNSAKHFSSKKRLKVSNFSINFEALQDPSALKREESNIRGRKGVGNIRKVLELKQLLDKETKNEIKEKILDNLVAELKLLPNLAHPIVSTYNEHPHVVKPAKRLKLEFPAKEFLSLAKNLNMIRTEALTALCGPRSYYFLGDLAHLEEALVKLFISTLIKNKFQLTTVPDIIPADVVENCGMTIRGERSQVYFIDETYAKDTCLSGTAEMALAGLINGKTFDPSKLPLLLTAVSRCYRSETSNVAEERGIYRVHQFTKVEMFGVCAPEQSEALLSNFLAIEEANFKALELDFQVLDMPLHELGAPAYRKHDIEAWFPGRQAFGEISSCSNCTDYQARRLGAFVRRGEEIVHVHTVNGTACAIPRMVMALFETHQQRDGSIRIPAVLRPFFGKDELRLPTTLPKLKLKGK